VIQDRPLNIRHSPPEKVTSFQLLGAISSQKLCDVIQIPRTSRAL